MKQIIIIFVIIPSFLLGQGWEKTFGGDGYDHGVQVQQTTDGGYIIVGDKYIFERGGTDIYLIKTDSNGDTLWTKTYGNANYDYGFSVQQTDDGGYILVGELGSDFGPDAYMIKTNDIGDTLWTKKYEENRSRSRASDVKQTPDGGYIFTGYISQNYNDIYLVKTNSWGDTLWTRSYDNGLSEYGFSVSITSDGGYLISGTSGFYDVGQCDIYLIKTDNNGDTLWTKTIDNNAYDDASMARQTSDGGFIIIGVTDSTLFHSNHDLFMVKTDGEGNTLWTKTYKLQNGSTSGFCIQQTTDNGYIITGITYSLNNSIDILLMKTDIFGDTIWTKTFGGEGVEYGNFVEQTLDGGFIITGSKRIPDGDFDVVLIKTDENGSVLSTVEMPVPNKNRKLIKIIDLQGREITQPRYNEPFIEIYDNGTTKKRINFK